MNKKILFFAILLTASVSALIVYKYISSSKYYLPRIENYANNTYVFNKYTFGFETFFIKHFRYPENIDEYLEFYRELPNYEEIKYFLKDPFSQNDSNYLYIPLYSKYNGLIEGYMLISAGIDGEINNSINDTIFIQDNSDLKFYNSVQDSTLPDFQEIDRSFHFWKYLFGNKDLLVYQIDGISNFIRIAESHSYSQLKLRRNIDNKKLPPDITFYCTIIGVVKEVNDIFIIIGNEKNNVNMYCNMYKGRNFSIKQGDSVKILGQFINDFESENNIIHLSNCIQIPN